MIDWLIDWRDHTQKWNFSDQNQITASSLICVQAKNICSADSYLFQQVEAGLYESCQVERFQVGYSHRRRIIATARRPL